MLIVKTFRYRLYPSKAQEHLLEQTLETCRRFYNACLAERKEAYEQRGESIGKYAQLREVTSVNSRPMYTSHSRIDMYHQNECGGG